MVVTPSPYSARQALHKVRRLESQFKKSRRCLFPTSLATKCCTTNKNFSCLNAPSVMLPSFFTPCLNSRKCGCTRFQFKLLNIEFETYRDEDGEEAERIVVQPANKSIVEVQLTGMEGRIQMKLVDDAGTECTIVIDPVAIRNDDSTVKEMDFRRFAAFSADMRRYGNPYGMVNGIGEKVPYVKIVFI